MDSVSVIIAAYNSERTIVRAIRSALSQAEVSQVIVVNDASTDATRERVEDLTSEDARVVSIQLPENSGPAAARNRAIETASGDYIAILDADDEYLPGRFKRLLQHDEWDMIADNIVFVRDLDDPPDVSVDEGVFLLSLTGFLAGNTPRLFGARTEFGFLKPVFSAAFLKEHGLSYNESLRLGEDLDLYVRMLDCGAKFKITLDVGYVSLVRDGSLSASHSVEVLRAFYKATLRHVQALSHDPEAKSAARRHARTVRRRLVVREFLAQKKAVGLSRATFDLGLRRPLDFPSVVAGVARDKIGKLLSLNSDIHGQILLSTNTFAN